MRVQEIDNDIKDINAGKMPKTIDCEIKDDLIDQVMKKCSRAEVRELDR